MNQPLDFNSLASASQAAEPTPTPAAAPAPQGAAVALNDAAVDASADWDESIDTAEGEQDEAAAMPDRSSAWTLPILFAGIALIAACLLIPAADENRQLVRERERLSADLTHVQKQIAVNDEFLRRVSVDPSLLERLAQRQMKMVREGEGVLDLGSNARNAAAQNPALKRSANGDASKLSSSPFLLLNIATPEPLAAAAPIGGHFADLCRHPRTRLFLIGGALLLMATALVTGVNTSDSKAQAS